MSNFGFSRLRVVQPYAPSFREARSAVGATELLKSTQEYRSVAEAIGDCRVVVGTSAIAKRQLQQPVHTLDSGGKIIRGHLSSGRVALLFGSEKTGLSNEELSHCNWLLHIATEAEHVSMNLGQAVAVTLYELVRERQAKESKSDHDLANASDLERLTQLFMEAATASGFVKQRSAASGEQKLRRLMRRLHLEVEDAELLLGLIRQILWKMRT